MQSRAEKTYREGMRRFFTSVSVIAVLAAALTTPIAAQAATAAPVAKWPKPPANTKVTFRFGLLRDDAGAAAKLKDVSDPTSTAFRSWLDESAINASYGASSATKKAVRSYFKQHGFTAKVDPSGVFVAVTGKASQWTSLLNVPLTMTANDTAYDLAGTAIFARKAPVLPSALIGLVTEAVYFDVTSQKIKGALPGAPAPTQNDGDPVAGAPVNNGTWVGSCTKAEQGTQAYSFGQVATAYGITNLSNTSVGVVTFGEGIANRSLHAAENCWGWPNKNPRYVLTANQTKKANLKSFTGFSEPQLDAQIVRGFIPNATLVNYQGFVDFNLWFNVLAGAYNDPQRPSVLSISYEECELNIADSTSSRGLFDAIALRLGLAGTSVLTASGDSGAAMCDATTSVGYPATSPYVLAVGGTRLVVNAANARTDEVAWNDYAWLADGDGGGASGGGVSVLEAKPWWQVNVATQYSNRVIPDVAAHSSMFPAWPVIYRLKNAKGEWKRQYDLIAGTSAATPLIATMIASANASRADGKQLGFVNPVLYAKGAADQATSFTDVTSGNNAVAGQSTGYSATTGFDLVTGWGVPKLAAFTQ